MQVFLGRRYGSTVARIVADGAGKEYSIDPVKGGAGRPHGVRPLGEIRGDRRPHRWIVFDNEHTGHGRNAMH